MKIRSTVWGVLAVALIPACGAEDDREEVGAPPVVIANVEVRHLEDRIDATGELVAKERAQIASEVSGRVTEVLVDEGEAVEVAQVLLEIDPERRNLELANARAGLTEAEAALGEQKRPWASRNASTGARAPSTSGGSPRTRPSIRSRRLSPWPAPAPRQPGLASAWPSARCATRASGPPSRV
jgi:multidrug efflux pump subunit AcrA (membrane-fusion protein)